MCLAPVWRTAFDLAWQAYGDGSVPVGAAVTDAEGAVLSVGRCRRGRQGQQGMTATGGFRPLAHAEIQALEGLDDLG